MFTGQKYGNPSCKRNLPVLKNENQQVIAVVFFCRAAGLFVLSAPRSGVFRNAAKELPVVALSR